jgi:hypothetical protein
MNKDFGLFALIIIMHACVMNLLVLSSNYKQTVKLDKLLQKIEQLEKKLEIRNERVGAN